MTNIRLRTLPTFPANVGGAGPIAVDKSGGIYTVSFDLSGFSDVIPPSGDWSSDKFFYWNSDTGSFALISLTELISLSVSTPTPRIITTTSAVAASTTDQIIVFNLSAPSAMTVNLPAVATRNPVGLPLEIYDFSGLAGDITINPHGTETIMGANSAWTVKSGGAAQTGGAVKLIPSTDLSGWLLR